MYPIALDVTKAAILLIGEGPAFAKRKAQLEEAGATKFSCHSRESGNPVFNPSEELDSRFHGNDIIMVAGLSHNVSKAIYDAAKAAGKLVNVEDVPALCDFAFMAHVRRGDLVLAVSTSGASPTLAKRIRDDLAARYGQEWEGYLGEARRFRDELRAAGKNMKETMLASETWIAAKGWFKP